MEVKITVTERELNALEEYIDFLSSYQYPCVRCYMSSQCASNTSMHDGEISSVECSELSTWKKKHDELYLVAKELYVSPHMQKFIDMYRDVVKAQKIKFDADNKYEIIKNRYDNAVSDELTVIEDDPYDNSKLAPNSYTVNPDGSIGADNYIRS